MTAHVNYVYTRCWISSKRNDVVVDPVYFYCENPKPNVYANETERLLSTGSETQFLPKSSKRTGNSRGGHVLLNDDD